ncbi:MAG: mannose-1-phosphate guanylyltransferase/mannose-6-phosphate isomerase [Chloroflexi bacterium]|nr:mannose-1-phosphate guanylyltransferase/mannose-6-phosphate isomerase [Chloroflexota bacterium]
MSLQPVILSGGSGTRLWPLSREFYPKQFLNLLGENSMFQLTINRLDNIVDANDPIIVCNEEHRFLVLEQLKELNYKTNSIILESIARNTAPALTLAALDILNSNNSDTVMLVLPADHIIGNTSEFHRVINLGKTLAEKNNIVMFGIEPKIPNNSYGYIELGDLINIGKDSKSIGYRINSFIEKPDISIARDLIQSERYLWNSGIFMLKPSVWLNAIKKYQPDIYEICSKAYDKAEIDGEFLRPDSSFLQKCPEDSIDYAVMENLDGQKESNSFVLPFDSMWSDLGSWSALWGIRDKDSKGNVQIGDIQAVKVKNSLLFSNDKMIAALGLEDVIVIETSDAVLVTHRGNDEEVKQLVKDLKIDQRSEYQTHRKVHRPWGNYEILDSGEGFQVKKLNVKPGASLSLQVHNYRAEHWVVVSGIARVTIGENQFLLKENESTYVQIGVKHRLENVDSKLLEIIEVQSGNYLGEDDIKRFEDKYNR